MKSKLFTGSNIYEVSISWFANLINIHPLQMSVIPLL